MSKQWMIVVALIALGCGDDGDDPSSPKDPGGKTRSDTATADAGTEGAKDSGQPTTGRDASPPEDKPMPPDNKPPTIDDAGSIEVKTPDGGVIVVTPGVDSGTILHGSGSCCEAHDTPGCGNADLEVCVCELKSACCTEAWTLDCALIVKQRYCQDGVRDCVLETWGQEQCRLDWTSSCDTIGEKKCEQVVGCF